MRFSKQVAILAIIALAVTANAQNEGTLRTIDESQATQGVVIMNSNSNSNTAAAVAPVQQPTTIVEAQPVQESRAELMRKARQNAEVSTEQKIVEKLEESRLREEQQRAERLFGDKLDPQPAAAVVVPVQAAPVIVEEPAKPEPVVTPTQVTIEKVEIVQPAPAPKEEWTEPAQVAPVAVSKIEAEQEEDEFKRRLFVSGILGTANYQASNVKSNYGLGVSVGSQVNERWAVEGTFLYTNHTVDTYWDAPLYRDLDQYDLQAAAKYYFLTGKLRPYLGGSVSYIYRKYSDRVFDNQYQWVNQDLQQEETHAVNAGLVAGVDFMVDSNLSIGGGIDYNFNMMTKNDFDYGSYYGGNYYPENTKALEEIDYMTLKLNAKMMF